MTSETSPTARALLVLELIQDHAGITAERLGRRLGVSERAARRYVAILREAGIPIKSTTGRYGGYRTGRGVRVPPLMFTATEALGLVMAVLEGHGAADSTDAVGTAVGKIVRVLPAEVAEAVEAVRRVSTPRRGSAGTTPVPETTAALVQACAGRHRLRIGYQLGADRLRDMDVDPWDVVIRHNRWYLLCWSHTVDARRVFRVDRVATVTVLDESFVPPADLDPVRAIEEHLAQGWRYAVQVEIDAPPETVARCLPPNLGRLDPLDDGRTLLIGSTDVPDWYAEKLATLAMPFRAVEPVELQAALRALGNRLVAAGSAEQVPEPVSLRR